MKSKFAIIAVALVIVSQVPVQSQVILKVSNGEDDVGATHTPVARLKKGDSTQGLVPINSVVFGTEGISIKSLCSINSEASVLEQSRRNARGGLLGANVPMNRSVDPAAWYGIPKGGVSNVVGWQWYDLVYLNTTNGTFWEGVGNGTNGLSATQKGHQIVVHAWGLYPVSAYTCRISTTISNIAAVTFNVATNTSNGAEIEFNDNFIGFDPGTDGVWESYWDPALGRPIAGGDDTVLTSGGPETNSYASWLRFGSRTSVAAGSPQDLPNVRAQFGHGLQSFTAELMCTREGPDTHITETVYEAVPRLGIAHHLPGHVALWLQGGQLQAPYGIQMRSSFTTNDPWVTQSNLTVMSGVPFAHPAPGSQGYFRAYQKDL